MKNKIIAASLLVGSIAYGQIKVHTGLDTSIGNENPFLDASAYNNFDNNVGKGLYFPTTDLKTWEFKTNSINPGKFKNYFDGMVVYNTGEGAPTTDASKGGIRNNLTRGFYYFKNPNQTFPSGNVANGEWIRISDTQANDQLWAQRDNNGVQETYLKPADAKGDVYSYSEKNALLNLGGVSREDSRWVLSGRYGYSNQEVPLYTGVNSSRLPLNSTIGNPTSSGIYNTYKFSDHLSVIKEEHAGQGNASGNKFYIGKSTSVNAMDVTSNINGIEGFSASANVFSNTKVGSISAFVGEAVAGSDVHAVTASNVTGAIFRGRNFAKSTTTNLVGVEGVTNNYGTATNITAGKFTATSSNTHTVTGLQSPVTAVSTLTGVDASATNRQNSTTEEIMGASIVTNLIENSKATNVRTVNAKGYIQAESSVDDFSNVNSYVRAFGIAMVKNLYGFRFQHILPSTFAPDNMYGLYIEDVNKGSKLNYSIYTNEGEVRFGGLKGLGNRPVYADADGKLIIGDATNALTSFKWIEDTTNNSIKLAVNSAGTERTQYPVSITDEGVILGSSFRGVNGATIFPDYVFQKYYTGTSSIKADYSFKTLSQVEDFVKANGHLPGYQSAEAIKKQGYIDLMATQLTNVEKIEELYLHSIEQDKALKVKDAKIAELENELKSQKENFEARLQKLEALLVK
ncbi:hypothetical protein D1Z97_05865 [Riemerella anatipestifer]|uniref:hypothetical protein n=1 Tax=Riemerella anatipestifer TaxID=34085 RepID=UPI00129D4C72|nr:hypothetical protein [Riemerella anatipestifer]MRM96375.1 hypothetical protein [Riemerella anatipestifer]MRN00714.1 hypothetical protein [Riemerella anatipestifer]MRN02904.1 hypothetical protein [Riemerella anatipestifer]